MGIPEYIKDRFGKTIEEVRKAKTESKQQGREVIFKVKAANMEASECKKLCKKIGVEYKEGYEKRVLDYICSDESVDRAGDIIKQKGWDLTNFKKNPVVMAFHNYGTYPIGNALKVKVIDNKLRMTILFADKDINPEAEIAYQMANSGFMKAGSVGFMPIEYHYPEDKEREELGMGTYGVVFDKQELLEHTVCGIPMNQGALQESINKGIAKKDFFYGKVDLKLYDELIEFVEPTEEPEKKEVPEVKEVKITMDENIQKQIEDHVKGLLGEHKAGAKLSKKSKSSINTAKSGMETAIEALNILLEETDDSDNEKNLTSIDINLDTEGDEDENIYSDGSIIEIDTDN